MTDKKLLELAAKAVGIDTTGLCQLIKTDGSGDLDGWVGFNPKNDDGDALRLAVKLGLSWESGYALGRTDYWKIGEEYVRHDYEGSDVVAATRRAIVRAAAEIGRNMK